MTGQLFVDDLGPFSSGGCGLVGQERLEGFGEFASDVLAVVDEDLLEDGLVELPAACGGMFGFRVLCSPRACPLSGKSSRGS